MKQDGAYFSGLHKSLIRRDKKEVKISVFGRLHREMPGRFFMSLINKK
jgi:hypothetical protein